MGKKARFRTNRLFHVVGEGWYLECREGNKGPFPTRDKVDRYLEALRTISHAERSRMPPDPDDSGTWLVHDRRDCERRNDHDRRDSIRFETGRPGTRRSGEGRRRIDIHVQQAL